MKTYLLRFSGVLAIALLCPGLPLAAEVNLPQSGATPAKLVQAALKTELDGPSAARETLLKEALQLDPEFAPARWHLGFVRFDDQWLSLDEVAKRVAGDETLREYRQRRDALVDTADNQREMARWCHKQKLLDEERVHWAKVLEFEPQDSEALAALGLQLYDGRLLTKAQIAEAKKQEAEIRRATKEWTPKLLKWRKAIESGSTKDRLAALQELQKLSDPNAIPALEAAFAEQQASRTNDARNRLLIETVGRMPFSAATQVLLRRAILPDSEAIRNAAADELKKRPMHAYVPQLIAMLPGSLKTKFHVYVLPGGMVLHEHEVLFEGREADLFLTFESSVSPADTGVAMFVTPKALTRAVQHTIAIETNARAEQEQLDWVRARVQAAMQRATGYAGVNDARLWEAQYNEAYGWQTASYVKPVYSEHVSESEAYHSRPVATGMVGSQPPPSHSCFPAGTLVVTIDGARPIESLKLGDRVLTQKPMSGELQYKAVHATTLRQATPMLKIGLGSKSILATPGHPFWINGEGWRTAKQMKIGQTLHALHGAVVVRSVEKAPASEAYNLVVSKSSTYFVGEEAILVHDNTPLEETSAIVPGLDAAKSLP